MCHSDKRSNRHCLRTTAARYSAAKDSYRGEDRFKKVATEWLEVLNIMARDPRYLDVADIIGDLSDLVSDLRAGRKTGWVLPTPAQHLSAVDPKKILRNFAYVNLCMDYLIEEMSLREAAIIIVDFMAQKKWKFPGKKGAPEDRLLRKRTEFQSKLKKLEIGDLTLLDLPHEWSDAIRIYKTGRHVIEQLALDNECSLIEAAYDFLEFTEFAILTTKSAQS